MLLNTVLVTRSRSCHVKLLHLMLRLNIYCIQNQIKNEITFVNDNVNQKVDTIIKRLKGNADKILFVDFGATIDHDKIPEFLNCDSACAVVPSPVEGVDWNMFRDKVKNGLNGESLFQAGLHFDTEVTNQVKNAPEGVYNVAKTDPKIWIMKRKPCEEAMKNKKGSGIWVPNRISEIFEKLISKNAKVVALTNITATVTYPHECVSNILESAGITRN